MKKSYLIDVKNNYNKKTVNSKLIMVNIKEVCYSYI